MDINSIITEAVLAIVKPRLDALREDVDMAIKMIDARIDVAKTNGVTDGIPPTVESLAAKVSELEGTVSSLFDKLRLHSEEWDHNDFYSSSDSIVDAIEDRASDVARILRREAANFGGVDEDDVERIAKSVLEEHTTDYDHDEFVKEDELSSKVEDILNGGTFTTSIDFRA